MICRLSPYHRYSEWHTLGFSGIPSSQIRYTRCTNSMGCPRFVLISKFAAKITKIALLNKTCDGGPLISCCKTSTNVAKYIRTIVTVSGHYSIKYFSQLKVINELKYIISFCISYLCFSSLKRIKIKYI